MELILYGAGFGFVLGVVLAILYLGLGFLSWILTALARFLEWFGRRYGHLARDASASASRSSTDKR